MHRHCLQHCSNRSKVERRELDKEMVFHTKRVQKGSLMREKGMYNITEYSKSAKKWMCPLSERETKTIWTLLQHCAIITLD